MEVILSNQAKTELDNYAKSLTAYNISSHRINQKIENMRNALIRIGANPLAYPVCRYKDLGQTFYRKNPRNPYLRQFIYQDKSEKPWTFAYWVNEPLQKVIITKMAYSAFIVKESPEVKKILSLMERMENLN